MIETNRLRVEETAAFLRGRLAELPEAGVILGSGLGDLAGVVSEKVRLAYKDIPNMPATTIAGHDGALVAGRWAGKTVLVFQGRCHYYEGYSLAEVTFAVRVLAALGATTLLLTNAAGGLRTEWQPGDLMLITDHLNFMCVNPLRGPHDECLGARFPDLTCAYDAGLRRLAGEVAAELGLTLREGVYAAVSGPSYETPAEVRFLRLAGADAVGMSTVPEVIVARQAGMRVLAVSCLTNILPEGEATCLRHSDVVLSAAAAAGNLARLLEGVVKWLDTGAGE